MVVLLAALHAACVAARKNLFFFIADDLRPQLNTAYGQTQMITPHFDKFAEESVVFDRAYCNFAICSASRNSFLTGRNPDKTRVWNFINDFRQGGVSDGVRGSQWVTMPQLFKNAGYLTNGHGKLYHPNHPPLNDEPKSWSQNQQYFPSTNSGCRKPKASSKNTTLRFCPGDDSVPANRYSDVNVTGEALHTLEHVHAPAYKKNGTNFAFFLGFHFPHQSWFVPGSVANQCVQSALALCARARLVRASSARALAHFVFPRRRYPPATQLETAKHQYSPVGAPDVAFTAELDGNLYLSVDEDTDVIARRAGDKPAGIHGVVTSDMSKCTGPRDAPGYAGANCSVPQYLQQQLRLGYYAAVTHTDALFGTVVDKLDALGLKESTLVVVTGDHGWQLGEHSQWGKHTNWELAVHVPLMIRAPWLRQSVGAHTKVCARFRSFCSPPCARIACTVAACAIRCRPAQRVRLPLVRVPFASLPRSPLSLSLSLLAPRPPPGRSQTIVTLVDLYRTLASLTGTVTAETATTIAADVDGADVSYLVADPSAAPQPNGTTNAAYAQYSRCPGMRNWPEVNNPAKRDWYFNNW